MSQFNFSVSPTTFTVGTADYIAGDSIGGILELQAAANSGTTIIVDSISMTDKSHGHIPLTLFWFKATPASGTYTDGSPLAPASGDYANLVGVTQILSTDWIDIPGTGTAACSVVSLSGLSLGIPLTGTSLYCLPSADGSFSLTAGDLGLTVAGRRI